jgi:hypothetical protein
VIASVHGALILGLIWTAACSSTSEDRDPQAAATDVKKDKMSYEHEAVHINGGPGCE